MYHPQGFIRSPLMFLVSINDLHNVPNGLGNLLFADDSNLLISEFNFKQIPKITNDELEKIHTGSKVIDFL